MGNIPDSHQIVTTVGEQNALKKYADEGKKASEALAASNAQVVHLIAENAHLTATNAELSKELAAVRAAMNDGKTPVNP